MTTLKKNAARTAMIALLAAAPVAGFAAPVSGSPEQSVAADPDEYAAPRSTLSSSNGTNTLPLYDSFEEADVVNQTNGSLYKGDAKRDD